MTKTQYAKYLQSSQWQDRRKLALAEASYQCEKCLLPRWLAELVYDQDLHVHHLSYANKGHEESEDLEVLCRRCHELATFGRSELRAPKQATCELCGSIHWDYRYHLCPPCDWIINSTGACEFPGFDSYNGSYTFGEPVWMHLCRKITDNCFMGTGSAQKAISWLQYVVDRKSKEPPTVVIYYGDEVPF